MIPSRKSQEIPAGHYRMQPNAMFDNEAEMNQWLNQNIPGSKVVKTWWTSKLSCEVIAPEPKAKI